MPIFRYFVFVGGALLALLLGVNLVLTRAEDGQATSVASRGEAPPIRIRSDRKLPERIVLDTSQLTIVPPAMQTAAVAPQPPVRAAPSMSGKAGLRDTFAQFVPTEPKGEAATAKKAEARPLPRRKIARMRPMPPRWQPAMMLAQQPRFGFFNMTW